MNIRPPTQITKDLIRFCLLYEQFQEYMQSKSAPKSHLVGHPYQQPSGTIQEERYEQLIDKIRKLLPHVFLTDSGVTARVQRYFNLHTGASVRLHSFVNKHNEVYPTSISIKDHLGTLNFHIQTNEEPVMRTLLQMGFTKEQSKEQLGQIRDNHIGSFQIAT